MNNKVKSLVLALAFCGGNSSAAIAATSQPKEAGANSQEIPTQILKTGVSLNTTAISPNSMQLSDTVGLTPVLERIQMLRQNNLQDVAVRQDLIEAKQEATFLIQKANLDIDFTVAAIMTEREVYQEILSTFISDRDKKVARINAISFISNGVLWTVNSALAIGSINTTYARNPK